MLNVNKEYTAKAVLRLCLFVFFMLFNSLFPAAAPGYTAVAPGFDGVAEKQVAKYGMTPIAPSLIRDGVYKTEVISSSPYFRILEAQLTVEGDAMWAVLSMSSDSYTHVYMGTGQEASEAEYDAYIEREDDGDDVHLFTVPVSALNSEIYCAAFSADRQKWYDRKIVFDAASLPEDALEFKLPDYDAIKRGMKLYEREQKAKETDDGAQINADDGDYRTAEPGQLNEDDAAAVTMPDGSYSVEVTMTGGSGRASISSPTWYYVQNGHAYAKLLWSSTYYDYMVVNGTKYLNETTDGSNSTFTIPVSHFDTPITVIADTTAMGEPVEIEYELIFYSESIGSRDMVPQEAAKKVLIIALVIIVVGGILNSIVKKKRS